MSTLSVLSVGYVYDYPLMGGEKFYDLIPTLNDKFGLKLTESDFANVKASRKEDGLVAIISVSRKDAKIYQFINQTSKGVLDAEPISYQEDRGSAVRCKPVRFVEEISFLGDLTKNISITYDFSTADLLFKIAALLSNYSKKTFNSLGNNGVSGCIIRYFGTGEDVPAEYGSYPDCDTVCIIDVPTASGYTSYCLRTEVDYVNGIGH